MFNLRNSDISLTLTTVYDVACRCSVSCFAIWNKIGCFSFDKHLIVYPSKDKRK